MYRVESASQQLMAEDGTKLVDIGLDLEPERSGQDNGSQQSSSSERHVSFADNVNVRYIPEEMTTDDEDEEESLYYGAPPSRGSSRRRSSSNDSTGILHRPIYTIAVIDALAIVLAGVLVFNLSRLPWLDRFPESVGFLWRVLVFAIVIRVLFYLVEHVIAFVGTLGSGSGNGRRRSSRSRRGRRD